MAFRDIILLIFHIQCMVLIADMHSIVILKYLDLAPYLKTLREADKRRVESDKT